MRGYKLEPLKQSRTCSSVTSGRAQERSATGKPSLRGRCAGRGPAGGTAGPLAQPRTHSLCSLLWTPGTTGTPPPCPPTPPSSLPSTRDGGGHSQDGVITQLAGGGWWSARSNMRPLPAGLRSSPGGRGFPQNGGEGPGGQASSLGGRPDAGVSLLLCLLAPRVQGCWEDREASLPGRVSRFGLPSSPSECPQLCPD